MSNFLKIFSSTALLVLLVLPLAGCGGDAESEAAETPPEEPAERSVLVSVVDLQPEAAVDRLSLPADLSAERRAVLAAEISGSVEGVSVDDGDAVSRGRVLASVDTRSIRQQLAEAEALDRQARLQLERATNLFDIQSADPL
jgi:multidrug efflux pump subunit AcrA (membrane-fusion protein)